MISLQSIFAKYGFLVQNAANLNTGNISENVNTILKHPFSFLKDRVKKIDNKYNKIDNKYDASTSFDTI